MLVDTFQGYPGSVQDRLPNSLVRPGGRFLKSLRGGGLAKLPARAIAIDELFANADGKMMKCELQARLSST